MGIPYPLTDGILWGSGGLSRKARSGNPAHAFFKKMIFAQLLEWIEVSMERWRSQRHMSVMWTKVKKKTGGCCRKEWEQSYRFSGRANGAHQVSWFGEWMRKVTWLCNGFRQKFVGVVPTVGLLTCKMTLAQTGFAFMGPLWVDTGQLVWSKLSCFAWGMERWVVTLLLMWDFPTQWSFTRQSLGNHILP